MQLQTSQGMARFRHLSSHFPSRSSSEPTLSLSSSTVAIAVILARTHQHHCCHLTAIAVIFKRRKRFKRRSSLAYSRCCFRCYCHHRCLSGGDLRAGHFLSLGECHGTILAARGPPIFFGWHIALFALSDLRYSRLEGWSVESSQWLGFFDDKRIL